MGKTALGVILATVAMFVWGSVFWLSPLGQMTVEHAPNDAQAQAALTESFPESGAYAVPGDMEASDFADLHRQGPIAMVIVSHGAGREPMAPGIFAAGFVHELLVVILLAILLRMVAPALATYGKRVLFCTMVGLIGAGLIDGAMMIWWYAPTQYALMSLFYNAMAVLLAGLVLSAFIKQTD